MSIKVNTVDFKNYGKCVEISNDIVKVLVTVDVGPRIISYSFLDGENMLLEDLERSVGRKEEIIKETYGGDAWYIYGGHRLWTAPEVFPRTYYPDNDPVAWEKIDGGVRFTPPEQKHNLLQFETDVLLAEDSSEVTINHRITNKSPWEIKFAPWALTVLSKGGLEVVPIPKKPTGLLSNGSVGLWPYGLMNDKRVYWGANYITLQQDPDFEKNMKFGLYNEHGLALYFNHGDLFIKKYPVEEGGEYPDGGMTFETYTSNKILEMETLAPLKLTMPGETRYHSETWRLEKEENPGNDEAKIEEIVNKYNCK